MPAGTTSLAEKEMVNWLDYEGRKCREGNYTEHAVLLSPEKE